MKKLKKSHIYLLGLLLFGALSLNSLSSPKPSCAVPIGQRACCDTEDPSRTFNSFNNTTKQCKYTDNSTGAVTEENYLCVIPGDPIDPNIVCNTDNTGKLFCADLTQATPTPISIPTAINACCNYSVPNTIFDDGADCGNGGPTDCDNNGLGACIILQSDPTVVPPSSPTLCNNNEVCSRGGLAPDGRPLYACVPSKADVIACSDDPNSQCVNSAFGPIHIDPIGFILQFSTLGIGTGSGIAFIMLAYGAYKLVTSQGNPDAINAAKEIITAAIIGLVFMILGVSILQVIGFDILNLGNLGLGTR
jgi:hypothetical protein